MGPKATTRWKTGGRSSYWLVSRWKRWRLTARSKRMTPRPLPDLRSMGSAVMLPTMVSSFMRLLPGMTTGASACCRTPAGCSAVGLAVCLIVGVDDVLLDPAAAAHFVAVGFGPGADLRNVIPAASAASAPVASPWRWCGLSLHAPAFLDVGAEHIIESLGVFFGEV